MLNPQVNQQVKITTNGLIGVIVSISGMNKVGGMTSPLKKAKVRYQTKNGQVESWFPLGKLEAVKVVALNVEELEQVENNDEIEKLESEKQAKIAEQKQPNPSLADIQDMQKEDNTTEFQG